MAEENNRIHAHKLSPKGLRRKQQSIYFEPGLHAQLEHLANDCGITLSALVNDYLKRAVNPANVIDLEPADAHTSN